MKVAVQNNEFSAALIRSCPKNPVGEHRSPGILPSKNLCSGGTDDTPVKPLLLRKRFYGSDPHLGDTRRQKYAN